MSDLRDLSKLPEDAAYWDELETRIVSGLGPRVPEATAWWRPLASSAWGLSALAAAAAIGAILLLPARNGERAVHAGLLQLPASDPGFVKFVAAPAPPRAGTLLLPAREQNSHD
jgi:hypothetical protein